MTPPGDPRPRLLAIDPGREKTGLAVLRSDGVILERGIVPTRTAADVVAEMRSRWSPEAVVVGHGTGCAPLCREMTNQGLSFIVVDEAGTTFAARELYFANHPIRGWRRWIPRSLQTPPTPIDDYAAVCIGLGYLHSVSAREEGEWEPRGGLIDRKESSHASESRPRSPQSR